MKYLLICLFLAACGGGGDEDPQPPVAASQPGTGLPPQCIADPKVCE